MIPESQLRVGHAEREAIAAELREHYAEGRLTLDELNERLDLTLAAKTRADLDTPMRDLPSRGPVPAAAPGGRNGSDWDTGAGSGRGTGSSGDTRPRAAQVVAAMLTGTAVVCALFTLGMLGVFGIGVARPFGIVLVLAGLAFLRRMLFGRRRHHARPGRPHRRW